VKDMYTMRTSINDTQAKISDVVKATEKKQSDDNKKRKEDNRV